MTDPNENARLLQENRLYTSELTRKAMKAPESLEANEIVFLAECFERSMVVEAIASKDAEIERLRARIEVLEDAADLALDKLEYLMSLWGAEAITRRVADKLRDARYPVDAALSGRPPSE